MEGMRALGAILVRTRPVLRGMKLQTAPDGRLHIQLRVAGHTRWEIQRDARKLIIMLLRRTWMHPSALELELVTTERNGRELYAGEGRTQMTRRPRAAVKADGAPWDDYEWWGDELPTQDDEASAPPDPPATPGPDEPTTVPEAVEFLPESAASPGAAAYARRGTRKPPWVS